LWSGNFHIIFQGFLLMMPISLQFDELFKAGNQHCFINNQNLN